MKTPSRSLKAVSALVVVGAAFLMPGCSSTHQTRGEAQASPFLGNASQLRPGKSGEAKLVYVNPQADLRKYTKLQFEPVVLVAANTKSSAFTAMSKEDQKAVVDYVDARIRAVLGKDYAFVANPAADVMRLRVAITEAKGSSVVLDTLSSVMPPAVALSVLKTVATGTGTAVGRAGVEMELLDSASGERLAAGVDERAGRKYTFRFDKFSRYHAVESAFDYWAKRLGKRLADLRADGVGK